MNGSSAHSGVLLDLVELGQRLQQARTESALSLDDVAQKLHLPLATVADLEAGRSERIGTAVYLKGFLRSYLKLVGLPEAWAEQAIAASSAASVPAIMPAAGAVARRVSWLERYKWAASYVVGTALALTAVHWLVSNTPQLGFPEPAKSGPIALETPEQTAAPETAAPAVESTVSNAVDNGAPLGPLGEVEPDEAADELPVMASLNPFRVGSSNPASASPGAASVLSLNFNQDSWIEVRDQSGKRLAYEVIRSGEKRSFSEGAPFSVLIGNARGVRADVGGKDVELEPFTRGNVARFAVAESDGEWSPVVAE
ncbi:MAG: RodZ domain-containing protein [Lysobacterales bacterium]